MRLRLSAVLTIGALVGVYLGVPCLALARAHAAMEDMPAAPCEAGETPDGQLLCATPDDYTPVAVAPPDLAIAPVEPSPRAAADLCAALPAEDDLPPPDSPPRFLLHRALLI